MVRAHSLVDVITVTTESGLDGTVVVRLRGEGYATEHVVTVPAELPAAVGCDDVTREELVRASFEFLLQRESPTSILRRFSLDQITTFFPEYLTQVATLVRRAG